MFKIAWNPNKNVNGSSVTAAKRISSQSTGGKTSANTDMRVLPGKRTCPDECQLKK